MAELALTLVDCPPHQLTAHEIQRRQHWREQKLVNERPRHEAREPARPPPMWRRVPRRVFAGRSLPRLGFPPLTRPWISVSWKADTSQREGPLIAAPLLCPTMQAYHSVRCADEANTFYRQEASMQTFSDANSAADDTAGQIERCTSLCLRPIEQAVLLGHADRAKFDAKTPGTTPKDRNLPNL